MIKKGSQVEILCGKDKGKKGEIIWRFTHSGQFSFGCLIPGHYDAGMKGIIRVGS